MVAIEFIIDITKKVFMPIRMHLLIILSLCFSTFVRADVYIAQFNTDKLSDWESKSFVGETQYQIVDKDSQKFLKAMSNNSASGLAKKVTIDLLKTPYLNWTWQINNKLPGLDEQSKSGDDYAARIYVVIDGGWKIWQTKALNYVWSSNQIEGAIWDNAFAPNNAKMIAVNGRDAKTNTWIVEKQNVYLDLIAQYGDKGSDSDNQKAYRFIDALAIMTDTDNSQLQATAHYGDIYFSKE